MFNREQVAQNLARKSDSGLEDVKNAIDYSFKIKFLQRLEALRGKDTTRAIRLYKGISLGFRVEVAIVGAQASRRKGLTGNNNE